MNTAAEKKIARELGVTPVGLAVLCKAASRPDGTFTGGLASGNPGSAKVPLEAAGYITLNSHGGYVGCKITDAGREIVRRARAMGW